MTSYRNPWQSWRNDPPFSPPPPPELQNVGKKFKIQDSGTSFKIRAIPGKSGRVGNYVDGYGTVMCTQIWVCAIHTKWGEGGVRYKQVCTRVDSEGQKNWCIPCPTRGSNPGSLDLNSDSLAAELHPQSYCLNRFNGINQQILSIDVDRKVMCCTRAKMMLNVVCTSSQSRGHFLCVHYEVWCTILIAEIFEWFHFKDIYSDSCLRWWILIWVCT